MSDGDACNAFHVENQYRLYILSSLKKKEKKMEKYSLPFSSLFYILFYLFFLDILY